MWTYGGSQVGREFILGNKWDLFTLGWFGFWTVGGGAAILACLWNLFGKDVVTLDVNAFTLHRQILRVGYLRRFRSADLRNLRFVPECGCGRGRQESYIAFDFGAKTIKFADGVEPAEATQLIVIIRDRVRIRD
jgi:hypothetical protein